MMIETGKTRAPRVSAKAKPRERWTLEKRAEFLHHLSLTANVAASCRAVGMSEKGVYRLRQASEAFRDAWATALREGYVKLETLLLERAMNGTSKDVWHGGKAVGKTKEFSERLALQLLTQHRASVLAAQTTRGAHETDGELRDRIAAKLDAMSRRLEDD